MINSNLRAVMLATTLAISSLVSYSYAATSPTIVKVTLDGEADQQMKIITDKASVKAGAVEFDVTNAAVGTDHEVVLIKLKSKDQLPVVDAKKHRINESKLKSMGEVAGLIPGKSGKLKVKLAAGDYMLICNEPAHFEHGMYTPFTVTQ